MGDLITSFKVKDKIYRIKPIERRLLCDRVGFGLEMREVIKRPGGLILGEGDTGKSVYMQMLFEECSKNGRAALICLRDRDAGFARFANEYAVLTQGSPADSRVVMIFDGLDENEACASDILRFCNDPKYAHVVVWVTSRVCSAALRLQRHHLFEEPYQLDGFVYESARQITEDLGVDFDVFEAKVQELELYSFLRKPGSFVLLLKLYMTGGLSISNRTDVMESICMDFARTSRDGQSALAFEENVDIESLVDATSWIAVCLFLTAKKHIWLGCSIDKPDDALTVDEIPLHRVDKSVLTEALKRRLFEPLTPEKLRISYSNMPAYLVARWLSKHADFACVDKLIPRNRWQLSEQIREMLPWLGVLRPDWGQNLIVTYPNEMTFCHAAIERLGAENYFNLLLEANRESELQSSSFSKIKNLEFANIEAMRSFCASVLEGEWEDDFRVVLAAFILSRCTRLKNEHVERLVRRAYAGKDTDACREWLAALILFIGGSDQYPIIHVARKTLKFDAPNMCRSKPIEERFRLPYSYLPALIVKLNDDPDRVVKSLTRFIIRRESISVEDCFFGLNATQLLDIYQFAVTKLPDETNENNGRATRNRIAYCVKKVLRYGLRENIREMVHSRLDSMHDEIAKSLLAEYDAQFAEANPFWQIQPNKIVETLTQIEKFSSPIDPSVEKKKRGKGVCEFKKHEVHPKIYIDPKVQFVKIGGKKYSFTAAGEWNIINRFLRSIKEGDDHIDGYPVEFTAEDYNRLKNDARALADDYIDRAILSHNGNHIQYTGCARFKLNLLK